MSITNKYKGLVKLDTLDLPSPEFYTITNKKDIFNHSLSYSYYGWTIRTCRYSGYNEYNLYNAHNLSRNELKEKLLERYNKGYFKNKFHIIYKSWRFKYSINILFADLNYHVEVCRGTPKKLTMGRSNPDTKISIPFGSLQDIKIIKMDNNPKILPYVKKIYYYLYKINWESFSAEIAIKNNENIIFYDLIKIR